MKVATLPASRRPPIPTRSCWPAARPQGWIPFSEHLNRLSVEALLRDGFGILAEGPALLIDVYAAVLSRHRLAPSTIAIRGPVRWAGQQMRKPRRPRTGS